MPQVLFVFSSRKEGGRGLRPVKTLNLRKNLRVYLRKTRGGGGGLELFSQRENEKNLRHFLTVPKSKHKDVTIRLNVAETRQKINSQ